MKKLCYSAFVAFCSSIATIVAMFALADQPNEQKSLPKTYSLAEVKKHGAEADCWMVIEGKVYDLSAYLNRHPVGPSVMIPWCGSEATEGMRTKGLGSDHSDFAWRQLEQYLIGTVKKQ